MTFFQKQITVYGNPVSILALFLVVAASMGGFLFGYDTGQIADITPMVDFVDRFGDITDPTTGQKSFSNVRSGLIVGLLSIGTLAGALIGSYINDWIGRKKAIASYAFMVCIGIAIQISSQRVWQQYAMGRFVAGLGVGALSSAVPVYQAEVSPKALRGTLTATYQLFITIGILVAYCFAIGTRKLNGAASWRLLVGLGMVFATILGVAIMFMPESPRYLMKRGNFDEARRSLCRMRGVSVDAGDPYVEHDYQEIYSAMEEEKVEGAGTWIECFGPVLFKRTMIGIVLQMFQQLTGANYFFYYGASLFTGVGLSDSYVTQIILGAVNVVTTFPGLWFLEKFGRRTTLVYGSMWQSAWLFAYAIAGTVKNPDTDTGVGKFMIVATCFFITGYASTWGPGIWTVMSETFPTRTRSKQAALATASNWLWNFLLAFFTPLITGDIRFSYGFVFAGCNLAAVFIVYFFVNETAGLSLEAVDHMYLDKSVKPWKSGEWCPPGYAHRRDAVESMVAEKKGLNINEKIEHQEHAGRNSHEYDPDAHEHSPTNSVHGAVPTGHAQV